jgi:hypothetical protein
MDLVGQFTTPAMKRVFTGARDSAHLRCGTDQEDRWVQRESRLLERCLVSVNAAYLNFMRVLPHCFIFFFFTCIIRCLLGETTVLVAGRSALLSGFLR